MTTSERETRSFKMFEANSKIKSLRSKTLVESQTHKDTFYEVDENSCNCKDYEYRCSKNGTQCKHMLYLKLQNDLDISKKCNIK